jgi:hypothetical protein
LYPENFGIAMNSRLRIIVTGMVAQYPVGGVAWDYLQYVIGLARLGHDVFYHEDTWCWPYHPVHKTMTADGSYSANYLKTFFERFAPELATRWHYLHLHETSYGMQRTDFDEIVRTADLFINVSGASLIPEALSSRCIKVFIDTDPGFNQIILSERPSWSENVERWCASVSAHHKHFTYGENIGASDCAIPSAGLNWRTTRMPVVLDLWELFVANASSPAPWSTVMTWNVFKGNVEFAGVEFHGKGVEFHKIIGLPRRSDRGFRVAIGGTKAPLEQLSTHGWIVEDGPTVTLTPADYQNYILGSRGEISVAKDIYVALRTGWFSCRSACYLAAARPVVVQDTGFTKVIPTGMGAHAFTTGEEAQEALAAVDSDYAEQAQAARELARSHFDAAHVLTKLIDAAYSE